MSLLRFLSLWLASLLAFSALGAETSPPKLDKSRLESYIRYAEGFTSGVQLAIGDPVPSSVPGYYRLVVHLTAGAQKLDRTYYLTPDGQHLINGNIWTLGENPFAEILNRLPRSGPSFGPANAKVTIVVFSDFQCPFCRQFARTLRDNVPQKYPNDVRVVFADFPIDSLHKWARAAAEAGHCIGDGNDAAFWAFHDWIFEHQGEINEADLKEKVLAYAKDKGLDSAKIAACIDSHATAAEVEQNEKTGMELGIDQTPTLFINGRLVSGAIPWPKLETLIQYELARPKDLGPLK